MTEETQKSENNKRTVQLGSIDRDMIAFLTDSIERIRTKHDKIVKELERCEGLREYYVAGLAQKAKLTGELNYDYKYGKLTGELMQIDQNIS